MFLFIFKTILAIFLLIAFISSINIVSQYQRLVVLRLGKFRGVRGPGFILLLPFGIDRGIRTNMRTTTWDLEAQEAITKDNVSVTVSATVWNKIIDPERAVVAIQDVEFAVRQLAATTMRKVIGQHELDEVLSGGESMIEKITEIVDKKTDEWGIKIDQIEITDVQIPENMKRVIAQKAEAAREASSRLIKADGELQAAQKLSQAADVIARNPMALELRRMQMLAEIGAEQNTTTMVMMPTEFVAAAGAFAQAFGANTPGKPGAPTSKAAS